MGGIVSIVIVVYGRGELMYRSDTSVNSSKIRVPDDGGISLKHKITCVTAARAREREREWRGKGKGRERHGEIEKGRGKGREGEAGETGGII